MKLLSRLLLKRVDSNLHDLEPHLTAIPRSTSPERFRCCGQVGMHDTGCSRLDRWDAGETR